MKKINYLCSLYSGLCVYLTIYFVHMILPACEVTPTCWRLCDLMLLPASRALPYTPNNGSLLSLDDSHDSVFLNSEDIMFYIDVYVEEEAEWDVVQLLLEKCLNYYSHYTCTFIYVCVLGYSFCVLKSTPSDIYCRS